jgi:putative membrane protein
MLQRDGVIGWVLRQSPLQRRVGIATLVATTAAGSERIVIVDIPVPAAISLMASTTPTLAVPFLTAGPRQLRPRGSGRSVNDSCGIA